MKIIELINAANVSKVSLKQDLILLAIGIICYGVKTGINLEEYSFTGKGIKRNSLYGMNLVMAVVANMVMFFALILAGTHLCFSGVQYTRGSYADTSANMEKLINETYFAEIEAMKSANKELEEMGVVFMLDDPQKTADSITKSVTKHSSSFYVQDHTGKKVLVKPL